MLGLQSCAATGLIKRIDSVDVDPSVFEGLGCLKDFVYDIDFIDNPSFEIHAARKIPHAYRQQVKEELDSMEKQGVIRKITEATPAVSPMVVVKQRGRIRICMSYGVTNPLKHWKKSHQKSTDLPYSANSIVRRASGRYSCRNALRSFSRLLHPGVAIVA